MTAAVIILSIALAVLFILCFEQRKEINTITKQLNEIRNNNTNNLLHSENGTADKLIREINELLKQMREIKISYNQKKHSLEQMMTNISHDLRTPLTSAMGYIDLIQNAQLSQQEKIRELNIIEKRLIRLEQLINSFFELTQIISSGKEPEKSQINLVSVLEEAIVHYYDDYCTQNRKIIFKCEMNRLIFSSNYNMLLRIFDNLISNALKHGKGDLIVLVNISQDIQINFQNQSVSSDVDMEHIFDEFYTTDISRTKGNTGLGLAIAKEFTQLLNGEIYASLKDNYFILTVRFEK